MIDDNDLTADAFENDNKEHLNKEFGRAIVGRNEVLDSGSFGSIADPQYSPLAFMKPDNASGQKNTPLAASIEFLCYIVKGNMIRVINTENPQEKLLIKGHTNEISDIKFSYSGHYLCSVSSDMINIWKLMEGPNPNYESVLQLPFGGNTIEPHPCNDGAFAVSSHDDSRSTYVALISKDAAQVHSVAGKFEELSSCELIRNTVVDMAFSPDGHTLYIGTPTSMTKFNVGVSSLTKAADSIPFQEENPDTFSFFGVKCFATPDGLAVVTCHCDNGDGDTHDVSLNVCINNAKVQTMSFSLPLIEISSTGAMPTVEQRKKAMKIRLEPRCSKYFVITSSYSNRAACFAVRSFDSPRGYPIYHTTQLNIRYPMSGATVLVCTKEQKEHLVISCQQEISSIQGAIQQYNIPINWIFQSPSAVDMSVGISDSDEKASTPRDSNSNASGSGLLSMLGLRSAIKDDDHSSSSSEKKTEGDVTGTSSALMSMVYGGSKQSSAPSNSLMSYLNSGTTPVMSPSASTTAAVLAPGVAQSTGMTRNDLSTDTIMTLKAHEASLQEANTLRSTPAASSEDEEKKALAKKEKKQKDKEKEKQKERDKEVATTDLANDDKEEKDPIRLYFKLALKEQAKALVKQVREDLTKHESNIKTVVENSGGNGDGGDLSKISRDIQETVKVHMAKQFRANFENVLLPAFEAGTKEMFNQMNAAFQEGVAKMVSQTQAIQSQQSNEITALRAEVQNLRIALSQQSVGGSVKVVDDNKHEITDPMELVNSLKYFEAVQLACERKNINALEQVLETMTPMQFLEECKLNSDVDATLLIMCVVQQITASLKAGTSSWSLSTASPWLSILTTHVATNEQIIHKVCGGEGVVRGVLSGILADLEDISMGHQGDKSSLVPLIFLLKSK